MTLWHYQLLAIQYPALKNYIISCYERDQHDEFLDFMFAIEVHHKRELWA